MPKPKLTTYAMYRKAIQQWVRDPYLGWRHGQIAFNLLAWNRPDLAERVETSEIDPFYKDTVLPQFYNWVERNW